MYPVYVSKVEKNPTLAQSVSTPNDFHPVLGAPLWYIVRAFKKVLSRETWLPSLS